MGGSDISIAYTKPLRLKGRQRLEILILKQKAEWGRYNSCRMQ